MTAITLYRIDTVKRMHRFYRLDVQPDLFGQCSFDLPHCRFRFACKFIGIFILRAHLLHQSFPRNKGRFVEPENTPRRPCIQIKRQR
jgi:hypothetical protein